MIEMNDYMTIAEIAENLGLTPKTVRELIVREEVPHLKISNRIRVKRKDYEDLLERKSVAYK